MKKFGSLVQVKILCVLTILVTGALNLYAKTAMNGKITESSIQKDGIDNCTGGGSSCVSKP
ncbi:MAG: hypothetical protein QE271_07905 [Bacteriovoracaceae bacterium]|nr:hypothetical protein [Bacteriovoracaceae bacterium]